MPTKTNAKPRRTKRACAQRARKLKRSGDPKAASRLARYCPPPGRRKPNAALRHPMGAATTAQDIAEWGAHIPPGTVIYGVLRRQAARSSPSNRAVASFVYVSRGDIASVPPNLSIAAGFAYERDQPGKRGGVVLPNGAGSVVDYVRSLGRVLHGDARSLIRYPGDFI